MPFEPDAGTATLPEIIWQVALDGLAVPVMVLRSDCAIVYCNSFGDAFLRAARIFRRMKGRLSIRRLGDDEAFVTAVAQAFTSKKRELFRLRQRTGEIGCLVHIVPLTELGFVLVSIAELRLKPEREEGWSRTLFGFNATGTGLAEALADGQSLAECSETMQLPIGTLRTRLKKLLARTGTSSQAKLAAVLLRGSVLLVNKR